MALEIWRFFRSRVLQLFGFVGKDGRAGIITLTRAVFVNSDSNPGIFEGSKGEPDCPIR